MIEDNQYDELAGFEEDDIKDNFDGTEDWDRMWNQTIEWSGHGNRIRTIAFLEDRNALLEYQGDDDEKVMQWISDNLDLDCPNQFMIAELAEIVDDWVLKRIKAQEARQLILTALEGYIGGC